MESFGKWPSWNLLFLLQGCGRAHQFQWWPSLVVFFDCLSPFCCNKHVGNVENAVQCQQLIHFFCFQYSCWFKIPYVQRIAIGKRNLSRLKLLLHLTLLILQPSSLSIELFVWRDCVLVCSKSLWQCGAPVCVALCSVCVAFWGFLRTFFTQTDPPRVAHTATNYFSVQTKISSLYLLEAEEDMVMVEREMQKCRKLK